MKGWRLLLTRPAAECAALAARLSEAGAHCACMPLLAAEALAETPGQRGRIMELDRYQAVIVISKPAARLGLEYVDRYWPQPPFGQRWFSVGPATGAILADYGLDVTWPEQGDDSEALLALPALADALAVADPRVLLLKGEGGRDLIAQTLRARGAEVDALVLYRRVTPSYPAGSLSRLVESERLNGLVVSSGQGLESLRDLAGDDWPRLRRLPLFVPSARVAQAARQLGATQIVECRGAGEQALQVALRELPAPTAS
ncbi:uroporphyrinogen-III synthase [Stutzerimonas tarimensis]|uniref:Uroporphyrinogen-III synthase n=1 Tax=Stutzerimonas tarimensis TaxID=1507735 RepID=A0ABV7T403_9GAMM